MIVLSTLLVLACAPTALLDFVIPKWKADKPVRIEDAYKHLYQATRGGEHAAPDRGSAKQWLEREWETLSTPDKGEVLWAPLCGDGSIGRLNLRVFKEKGGKIDDVLDAFLASSREYKESGTSFVDTWNELGKRLKRRSIGSLTSNEWSRLDAEMGTRKYPAIHHSAVYDAARHPAYRLLTADQYKKIVHSLK